MMPNCLEAAFLAMHCTLHRISQSTCGLVVEYIVATENTFNITCAIYLLNMAPRGLEPADLTVISRTL